MLLVSNVSAVEMALLYQLVNSVDVVLNILSNGKTSLGSFNVNFTSVTLASVIPGGFKYNELTSSAVMVRL